MTEERPATEETPAETPDECRDARRAIAGFVRGGLGRARNRRFRNHLFRCSECTQVYREAMAAAARAGRALRESREEHVRRVRSEGFRQRARDATADGRRPNRFGLRLALLPAAFALLVLMVRARGGDEALFAQWQVGNVQLGDRLMGEGLTDVRLSPGDRLVLESGALVTLVDELSAERPVVSLTGEAELFVVDLAARALRVDAGRLEVDGPARVQTVHGVLELEGRARLEVTPLGYRVECLEGAATWVGPTGTRALAVGHPVTSSLAADRQLALR